jgi:predicted glycosyltransferase
MEQDHLGFKAETIPQRLTTKNLAQKIKQLDQESKVEIHHLTIEWATKKAEKIPMNLILYSLL